MKKTASAGILALATALAATSRLFAAFDIGIHFSKKEAWSDTAVNFTVEHAKDGFTFASEERDIVNCLKHDTCVWHGLKIWETKVYFDADGEDERVKRIELSLYNKGDAKGNERIDVTELKSLIAAATGKLSRKGKKAETARTRLRNDSVQYRRRFGPDAELAWGLSAPDADNRRTVEYLRLTLTEPGTAAGRNKTKKQALGPDIKKTGDNVVKGPNGDVFIDNVPMVDQGGKGYCAAAVSERVLRYYGKNIDAHEIAQQAGTSAERGTSIPDMKRAITAIGEKNALGFQNIISMSEGIGDLEKEIRSYNKAAKAEKKPPISLADFTRNNVIHVSEMRAAMEPKVIYRMRCKDPRSRKFLSAVRQQVKAGIPVFWGVTLGIFPERGVSMQSTGGHMRLIIGYNDKKKEILYSDTWGQGHELKRMPRDWAFAITHDAFILKPR